MEGPLGGQKVLRGFEPLYFLDTTNGFGIFHRSDVLWHLDLLKKPSESKSSLLAVVGTKNNGKCFFFCVFTPPSQSSGF